MRIIGLSERTIKPQVAAVFKKGDVKQPNKPGKNLNYFRLVWSTDWQERYIALSEDAIQRYADVYQFLRGVMPSKSIIETFQRERSLPAPELFALLYGNEPKNVIISHVVFDAAMKKFGGNAMLHRCNGQEIVTHWTNSGYSNIPIACKAPDGVLEACQECQFSGELRFQVPDFSALCGRIIHFALYTKSPNEIAAMSDLIDSISEQTNINNVPFELYRYSDSFTIPINGKPSKTEQSMVGLMPFAVSQLQQLDVVDTKALPEPNRQLPVSENNPDENQDSFDIWLGELNTIISSQTGFDFVQDYFEVLLRHRNQPYDIESIDKILKALHNQWQHRHDEILFKIASGLAELEVAVKVHHIQVYQWNDDLRYEINLPFCSIRFFSLDEFRKAGYDKIDDVKLSPLEYAGLDPNPEKSTFDIVEMLDETGYSYLREDKSAWNVPMQYLEQHLSDEESHEYFIPIILKVHTKKDGSQEIQIKEVLKDLEDVAF